MDNHEVGNSECPDCWKNYPVPCKCGGLIHAQFGDEDSNGDYWLEKFCDTCEDDYEELDYY